MRTKDDDIDLEEMAGGAQALREHGIDPALHTAMGTAESIRLTLGILTDDERMRFLVALYSEIQEILVTEGRRQGLSPLSPKPAPAPSSKPN